MELREDKYREIVNVTVARLEGFQRGDIIPWKIIEEAMSRTRHEEGGWRIINRVRKTLLRDRDIVTAAIPRVGLRMLLDQEAAMQVPINRQRRAYRQMGRGLRELRAVREGFLTDRQRLAYVRQRQTMATERRAIGRSYRELANGARKTQTQPKRKAKEN
jgi:hypothetical protein